MIAPPTPNTGRPAGRAGRSTASTVLLYASLLVLIIIMLLVWQWQQKRSQEPPEIAPTQPPPPATAQIASRPAQALESQSATQPASAPAEMPATPGNISPSAVELSPVERIAFGAVHDRNNRLDETPFYMLLGRAAKMPRLSAEELDSLPRPATANILEQPSLFRAEAMRLKIRVFEVQKLLPEKGLNVSRHWPRDRPVWRVHAVNLLPRKQQAHALIVFMLEDPQPLLGKPDKVKTNGELEYFIPGKPLDLAAIFYKVYTTTDREHNQAEYPVFVAWQAVGKSTGSQSRPQSMVMIFIVVVLLLLAGFVFLKRYIGQVRRGNTDARAVYRPLRDRLAPQPPQAPEPTRQADAGEPATPPEDQVDPLLKRAAEDYQKERHQSDGTDHRG